MAATDSTVVTVISAKGGVGKSLLASNLAVAIAGRLKARRERTLLVDLCVGLGYDDLLLDLEPTHSAADLLPVVLPDPETGENELAPRHLDLATTAHASGLFLLAAPPAPNSARTAPAHQLDAETTPALLAALRDYFTVIVADCAAGLDPVTTAAVQAAEFVFVVLTPDVPTLRSTRRLLDWLSPEHGQHIGVVVNQYVRGAKLKPEEVADALGQPLAATLPIDQAAVWKNVGLGRPCVLEDRRGLGGEIRKLADELLTSLRRLPRR